MAERDLNKPSPGTLHGELREALIKCGDAIVEMQAAIVSTDYDNNIPDIPNNDDMNRWDAALNRARDVLASHPAPAPATRLCPVKHGAEHEMDLVWYCETCGHREAT